MDPERWNRIKELFSTVVELPPDLRAAWLGSALPDDPTLAGEVENLLAAHDGADDFYERGALAAVPELRQRLEGATEGMRLGPYRVISELGHGGMGAVYLAVRDEPGFTQTVAIKLIKRGMDTDEIVRRFVAERQILASLAHPNIARLLDGGSTPDGRPYFVMEHVEGQPITTYADEHKLSVEARLQLFLHVCRAVQRAHQSLVVHRDLKPANILVDAEGEPKLLDFGIAKLLDPNSFGGVAALTGHVPGPMTPDYASPEQLAGGPVTTATDVYGLGLLLYELLVGQSPRSVERKLGKGWSDRLPSEALAALKAPGNAETRRLVRRLTGDLDIIAGKALDHDPERRYGTAAALAEDVERHLTQKPVAARRPTLAYRLGRTLVRHKLAAALALAVCLLAAVSTYQVFTVSRERDRVEAERQRAEALNDFLQKMMQKANPEQSRGETLTVRQVLDAGAEDLLGRDSRYQPETWASLLQATGTIYQDLGLYEQAKKNLHRARQLRETLDDSSREGALALAVTLTALGNVSLRQEAYAEARTFFQRSLALRERWLGLTALALAEDLNGLGSASIKEGHIEEAGRIFNRACAISRLESRPRDLADCYNNLGSLAVGREEFARARFLFSMAFHYFRSTLGDDHPDTMRVRSNLAYLLYERADYAGAEALFQEIADVRRRLLEPNHPDLAQALLELAIVQHGGGHLDKARATLNELLRMRRDYRFPRDQSEAETWNLVAGVAYDSKDLDTADAAYVKSYEVYQALPGDQRMNLSNVLNGRVGVRLLRNNPAGALPLARRSRELAQSAGVQSTDAVARAEILLGRCYLALGQPSLARPYLEHSHKILLSLFGPEHPTTRKAATYLRSLNVPGG
jgi:tetratricopeptide (TPR) repeat protein